jgi:hypothetical protein
MGRSVQLPEFADLGALPAAHWGVRALGGSGMRITLFNRPATDLGAVELEGVESEGFGSGEAVRARWGAIQAFFEKVGDRLGPSGSMVTPRGCGEPPPRLFSGAGPEVIGKERIEAAPGEAELLGDFDGS